MLSLLSLINLSSARVITQTAIAYQTVTLFADEPALKAQATSSSLAEPVSADGAPSYAVSHSHFSFSSEPEATTLLPTPSASIEEVSSQNDDDTQVILSTQNNIVVTTEAENAAPTSTEQTTEAAPTSTEQAPEQTTEQAPEQTTEAAPTTSSEEIVIPTTSSTSFTTTVEPEALTSSEVTTSPEFPATTTAAAPTTTTEAASTEAALGSFEQGIVDYHNQVRAEHGAPAMVWNSTIAQFASDYLSSDNCVFKHSGGPYGENIAMGYPDVHGAMEAWYDEYSDYDYSAGQFSSATGHFTQMVWVDTTSVGCALDDCNGRPFLVCEYYPRGNVIGYFTENVLN